MHAADPSQRRRKIIGVLAWLLVLICAPVSLAWLAGSASMMLDLVATMQIQIVVVVCLLGCIVLCLRRWRAGCVLLVLAAAGAWPVVSGRTLTLPRIQYDHKPDGVLRVVSCNLRPENEHWEQAMRSLMDLDADLIILQEIPPELSRGVRLRGWLEGSAYPWYSIRGAVPGVVTQGLILSRHPLEDVDLGLDTEIEQHLLYAAVEHHTGRILAGQFHPRSPRSAADWRAGNEAIDMQLGALNAIDPDRVVIGADLNSTPAQLRARRLRSSGLRLSKPLLRLGGSYPSGKGVPGVLTIEIDGIWTRGMRAIAWDRIRVLGSDHRAIVTDFLVAPGP